MAAQRCENCGAELFAGQQFCRACGAATRLLGENAPTQILQPGSGQARDTGGAPQPDTTSRLAGEPTQALPPPRRRSRGKWILAFAIIAVMGGATLAALLFAISSRGTVVRKMRAERFDTPATPPKPPAPKLASISRAGALLDESGADFSDDRTVIKKSFALTGESATVLLKNVNGNVTVEGWDEPRAEVTVTKRGDSEEDRRAVGIVATNESNHLILQTVTSDTTNSVVVEYVIRVPRTLKELTINSTNSEVEVSHVRASVVVDIQRGRINLEDVDGLISTKIIKGHTKAALDGADRQSREANSFTSVNGDIELRLDGDADADLKAEVINGEIEIDDDFGLEPRKMPAGYHLAGRLGEGGRLILIKTVSGTIKIKK